MGEQASVANVINCNGVLMMMVLVLLLVIMMMEVVVIMISTWLAVESVKLKTLRPLSCLYANYRARTRRQLA